MPRRVLPPTIQRVRTLIVLNDPAYGTERSYNGLRLAHALVEAVEQVGRLGSMELRRSPA